MEILILGDSFAADWSKKYANCKGWPNLLANDYRVTNLAQAGCSEYKIYLQLTSVNLLVFDAVIISHTSPYRWYVKKHPVHSKDKLHHSSDLIYSDVLSHLGSNPELKSIAEFFEHYFDLDYAKFIHNLVCDKIESVASTSSHVMHIQNLDPNGLHRFKNEFNFYPIFSSHPGLINHYSESGNTLIYNQLKTWLKTCTK